MTVHDTNMAGDDDLFRMLKAAIGALARLNVKELEAIAEDCERNTPKLQVMHAAELVKQRQIFLELLRLTRRNLGVLRRAAHSESVTYYSA